MCHPRDDRLPSFLVSDGDLGHSLMQIYLVLLGVVAILAMEAALW